MQLSQFSITPGERIRINNELYHLRRKLGSGKWQLEKDIDGEYRTMEEKELLDLYYRKLLRFESLDFENQDKESASEYRIAKIFADYPENLQREAKRRLNYIRSIEGITGDAVKEELEKTAGKQGDSSPPHETTVKRWAKRFRNSGNNICSLIPDYIGRGNRKPRYSEEVQLIADREIREIYLNINKNTQDETLSAIRHAIEIENKQLPEHEQMPKPKRKFLRNIIDEMDAIEVYRARYGDYAAKKEFREAIKSGEIIMEPLERVELDHTKLDLIVVDGKTLLPLGRPTLTIAEDRCTRCFCGFHVGYDPASYVSLQKCMSHAIKPKEYIKEKYPNIVSSWPCYGTMDLAVVDNGPEFHSKDFEAAALSNLTDIRYCPKRQPWWKGAVERLFRTMGKSMVHTIPGTTFSNIVDKGDYKSVDLAIITEADLDELLHMWICDIYHHQNHRSTGRTPYSLWLERITSVRQTLPASVELLDVNLSSIEYRTLFHYGIGLNAPLTYNSHELQKIRQKYGKKIVQVRWDRSDLGFVHILDDDANTYLKVPCTWQGYANGISLWLHKAMRRDALSHEGPESEAKLDAAKARMREKVEEALNNKKKVTRVAAARAKQSFAAETPSYSQQSHQLADTAATPLWENLSEIGEREDRIEDIPEFEILDGYKKVNSHSEPEPINE
jgi:putative transposase